MVGEILTLLAGASSVRYQSAMTDDRLYRRGVGVMLINADKHVWVGRRIDNRDEAWQMPQGGLDKGEKPWAGARREL